MSRIQTPYDEWLEAPYYEDGDEGERPERDPDDERDAQRDAQWDRERGS